MNVLPIILGISNMFVGMLCIALAIPLLNGKIKRNAWYGVRFPQSFQSDEAWLAINRHGAKRLIVWSLPLVLFGLVTCFLPLAAHPWAITPVSLAGLIVLVPAFESWQFARRYDAAGTPLKD